MSTNQQQQQQQQQQQNHMSQLPQMILQYQKNIEFLNNNIALLRSNIERTDISEKDKEQYKKQEQELQTKLAMLQTLISNLNPQMVAQNLQQRVLSQQMNNNNQQQINSPALTNDNISGASAPGSPASFNPQQQQQYAQFVAGNPAQQQQIRTAQQQQQQQAMNKLGLGAQQLNSGSPQGGFPSPMTASPNVKGNVPVPTTAAAQAAVAAAAAAAAVKNNGIFTFPTNNTQVPTSNIAAATPLAASTVTTPGGSATSVPVPTPAPAPKPASAPSLDNDGVHRVLTKRKIQELVSQIDPSERLEPEVEDILLEIADEFIESVTTFACQLAKHRKSDTLEVKDVQLHLERNWNIRIPGFAADDIRPLRKPTIPSSHQAKVQAVNAAKSQISSTSSKKDHSTHN
ncbi:hypothetical protein [Parasitella parasitica]|uniref:TBP-associated factor 12 n=1 Tax=Parasitella parasitica TaxID=35722 RepID=A0A0B7NDU9_9FUNG|nr:hypothetical protein [Parasitella parasitica]